MTHDKLNELIKEKEELNDLKVHLINIQMFSDDTVNVLFEITATGMRAFVKSYIAPAIDSKAFFKKYKENIKRRIKRLEDSLKNS